jgi:hypothetical protein
VSPTVVNGYRITDRISDRDHEFRWLTDSGQCRSQLITMASARRQLT